MAANRGLVLLIVLTLLLAAAIGLLNLRAEISPSR